MYTTLSIIKADVGSIAGHVTPGSKLLDTISLLPGVTWPARSEEAHV